MASHQDGVAGGGTPPGEDRAVHAARHGVAVPRGQSPLPASRGGRFGEMFPSAERPDIGREAVDALAAVMARVAGTSDQGRIHAGYTYLGQFIDHDLTFDPTSNIDGDNDPRALVNFRTPRLDLDSLYGTGPADQPFLYEWGDNPADRGVKLLVGRVHGRTECHDDLPRNEQGRALLGDARNDENLIVSQLHLVLIQFHNAMVDRVRAANPALEKTAVFERARTLVRWHYQWVVVRGLPPAHRRHGDHGVGAATGHGHYETQRRTPLLRVGGRARHSGRVLRGGLSLRSQHGPQRLHPQREAGRPEDPDLPRAGRGGRGPHGLSPASLGPEDRVGPLLRHRPADADEGHEDRREPLHAAGPRAAGRRRAGAPEPAPSSRAAAALRLGRCHRAGDRAVRSGSNAPISSRRGRRSARSPRPC